MVPGFNTDFKYRGETYHVQTEDNGVGNPVVVTLLYHKGAILSSRRTSYKDIAGKPGFEQELKDLMKSQHKDLMKSLLAGDFDKGDTAPAVAGGTGEDPAEAAAAIVGKEPAPAPPPSSEPPLRARLTPRPNPRLPQQPATVATPKPLAPQQPRVDLREKAPAAAAAAQETAPRPSGKTLDAAIRQYLEDFAAATAATVH